MISNTKAEPTQASRLKNSNQKPEYLYSHQPGSKESAISCGPLERAPSEFQRSCQTSFMNCNQMAQMRLQKIYHPLELSVCQGTSYIVVNLSQMKMTAQQLKRALLTTRQHIVLAVIVLIYRARTLFNSLIKRIAPKSKYPVPGSVDQPINDLARHNFQRYNSHPHLEVASQQPPAYPLRSYCHSI